MWSLLTLGSQTPKLLKSDKAGKGYLSAIMYLSPYKISGRNVCPHASPGCIATCLNTAGRGRMTSVQQGRLRRTKLFFENRKLFEKTLESEISKFQERCGKEKAAIRLNGTSDIPWETIFPGLMDKFPTVQFYDYTKSSKRYSKFLDGTLPVNYHLTFSRSELNHAKSINFLKHGGTVAVVFRTKDFPKKWHGFKVFNADENDLRFLDYSGVQALYAKGKAKKDDTGFVYDTQKS